MKHVSSIKALSLSLLILFCPIIFSCSNGNDSPLIGTWADDSGNRITFIDTMTYKATIRGVEYKGNYTVFENAISLSRDTGDVLYEWDIRGSILYLWKYEVSGSGAGAKSEMLTLYSL